MRLRRRLSIRGWNSPCSSTADGIAGEWASKDPEALFKWAIDQGEGGARFIEPAARAMASRDPQRAFPMVEHMPPYGPDDPVNPFGPGRRRQVLWTIGQNWAQSDGAAALTWARSLPNANEMDHSGASLDIDVSRRVAQLTSAWAGRDPAAAATWVNRLPPGESQATAAANLALTWGRYDLPAAKAWVEKLPPGAARDKAGEQLTNLVSASGE